MIATTEGIVLHTMKYSETSLIARIYTEKFGLQSYLLQGIRKPSARLKPAFFHHLSILDLVVYHKEKSGLQRLKEAQFKHLLSSISTDIRKGAIALFLNEVISRSIREETPDHTLFEFLKTSILTLEHLEVQFTDFHLVFMIRFSRLLGFQPSHDFSDTATCFNLTEGHFQPTIPPHPNFLAMPLSQSFAKLLNKDISSFPMPPLPAGERNQLLDALITYFRLHLPAFHRLSSLPVLREVFS